MGLIRGLSFDLDETLLDASCFQASIACACEMMAASQPGFDAYRLIEANTEVWKRYWPAIERKWTLGELDGASVSLEAWRRTLQACGCNDEAVVQLVAQIHRQLARDSYRLFDDVSGVISSAKRARVPLALITNGSSDTQRDKLRVLEIEQFFDAVVISGEVGVAKPDAAAFQLALAELAIEPGDVWHIGDSLGKDVAGANAAGLRSVWLNRSGLMRADGDPKPDLEVRSLSELVAFLPK